MRIGVISGDGVPVSGLLTIFRNVVDLGRRLGLVENEPVPAELGYSWRPDKPGYFPDGPPEPEGPEFLFPSTVSAPVPADPVAAAAEWTAIRIAVAEPGRLDVEGRAHLRQRINLMARPYQTYFRDWLQAAQVDWVVAVNMTLSDAVPVTTALHQAAAEHYGRRGHGGVLFWDHDLFGSCAVHDDDGRRMYPQRPNEFTTVPLDQPWQRWAVVSESLADECRHYPTTARPQVVPNILPRVPTGPLEDRHLEFLSQQGISADQPVLLNPVRVFRVKGVEIALDVLAGARTDDDHPSPVMLVFGGLTEDPVYAEEIATKARALGLEQNLRFLEGVPLRSSRDANGRWHLDEVDLLRVAAAQGGGVVFTPNLKDVETVGLGPALAAVAGLPCAATEYDAFTPAYGEDFQVVRVGPSAIDAQQAGRELMDQIRAGRPHSSTLADDRIRNQRIVEHRFPDQPWSDLLHQLARAATPTP